MLSCGFVKILPHSLLKWFAPIGFTVISAVLMSIEGYRFDYGGAAAPLTLAVTIFMLGLAFFLLRGNAGSFLFAETFAFLIVFSSTASVLSYLMVSASRAFPLVDKYLSATDLALGFDWPAYFRWIKAHPIIDHSLNLAYGCWTPEWVVLPALLSYREARRVRELISLGVIAVIAMMPLTACLPALSAFPYYFPDRGMRLDWVQHINALRDGSMQTLDLINMTGLVSIPSFHTVGALLFIYVSRNIKILFPLSVTLNLAIIFSTLSAGSHHLMDIIAGSILAALVISLYRILSTRIPDTQPLRIRLAMVEAFQISRD